MIRGDRLQSDRGHGLHIDWGYALEKSKGSGRPEAMEGRPLPCLPPASHSLRALFEALPRRSPAPRLCRPILAGRSPAPFRQNCQNQDTRP